MNKKKLSNYKVKLRFNLPTIPVKYKKPCFSPVDRGEEQGLDSNQIRIGISKKEILLNEATWLQ
ncbi:MAG: hypothetical protein LAT67_03660 [Balneolales bacterium]|nr:hypothetical protein [Balneolales bacterium]